MPSPYETTTTALPLHATPTWPNGRRGGQQHETPSNYYTWDYLKGEGPSSAEHYYDPLEKKTFRPGWQSLRRQADIKQDAERKQFDAYKEQRETIVQKIRRQRSLQRHLNHGFNPITGQEYNQGTGRWTTPTDGWQHQKVGIRPGHVIQSTLSGTMSSTARPPGSSQRLEALKPVVDMRKERIASCGLSPSQRKDGGVKELLNWGQ